MSTQRKNKSDRVKRWELLSVRRQASAEDDERIKSVAAKNWLFDWFKDIVGISGEAAPETLQEKLARTIGLDRGEIVYSDFQEASAIMADIARSYEMAVKGLGQAESAIEVMVESFEALPQDAPSLFDSKTFAKYYQKQIMPLVKKLRPNMNLVHSAINPFDAKFRALYEALQLNKNAINKVLRAKKSVALFTQKDIFDTDGDEVVTNAIADRISDDTQSDLDDYVVPILTDILTKLGCQTIEFEGADEDTDDGTHRLTVGFSFTPPPMFNVLAVVEQLSAEGYMETFIDAYEFVASTYDAEMLLTISIYGEA